MADHSFQHPHLKEERLIKHKMIKMALSTGSEPIFFIDEDADILFLACQIIGHYTDIRFVEPPKGQTENMIGATRLEEICRYSHVRFRQIKLEEGWWKKDGLPILGFLKSNHEPIVLLNLRGSQYIVIDPLTNKRKKIDQENSQHIFPLAYTFYAPLPEKVTARSLLRIFYRQNQRMIWEMILRGSVGAGIGLFSPFITKSLFDQVIPDNDYETLYQIVFGLVIMAINSFAFQATRSFILLRLSTLFQNKTNAMIWDHLLRVSLNFFRRYGIGDLIQRVAFINYFTRNLSENVINAIFSAFFSIIYLVPMFIYSWQMTIIGLLTIAISFTITLICFYYQMQIQSKLLELGAQINLFLIQVINGISKIRVDGAERRIFRRWGEKFSSAQSLGYRSRKIQIFVDVVTTTLSSLFMLGIYAIGIYLLENPMIEAFTIGTFMAFTTAYTPFVQAVSNFLSILISLSDVRPYWQRTQVIFQEPIETSMVKLRPGQLTGEIWVEHLYFRYHREASLILRDINMRIKPGEFIGIVGFSGCGKSTLLRLLMGFEQPERGYISYNQKDLSTLDVEELRRSIGVVLQGTSIIAGTLYDNIVCGRKCTPDQVQRAIFLSGLHEVLKNLPMGLHTVLTTGGNTLSGGQKQRIALARALLTDPKILLLDEATSALDAKTQEQLTLNLDSLKITRIVVAHRLSTILKADRIFVMDQGQIVDTGTYAELASRKEGLFRTLVEQQHL